MSAAPIDYPPAVLEEAEDASRHAFEKAQQVTALDPERRRSYAAAQAANAYAAVLARYTVSQRLVRSPGGVLVLDTPGEPIPAVLLSDEPPVDEDARELADAYERGRADMLALADRFLKGAQLAAEYVANDGRPLEAAPLIARLREGLAKRAAKRGAVSS